MDEFFVKDGEVEKGPFTFDELTDGRLEPNDLVRTANTGWEKASDILDFAEYFQYEGYYFPTENNLAGFGIRLLAFMIDYIIISFFVQLFLYLFARDVVNQINSLDLNNVESLNREPLMYALKIYAIAIVVYNFSLNISPLRCTLGHRLFKLMVVDADGNKISILQSLVRSLCKLISFSFYGIGFISVLFSRYKQGFHDALAKTYVVKRGVF